MLWLASQWPVEAILLIKVSVLFVRDLWYVCACVYESSEASAYSFGLATNPTRAEPEAIH